MAGSKNSSRWIFYLLYLSLSASGIYYFHFSPASQIGARSLNALTSTSAPFAYPDHPNVIIRRVYTGFSVPDSILSCIVTIFLAGPAGFSEHIRIQQINFLLNLGPLALVFSIESIRAKRWSLAVLYQSLGGAIIVPLYFVAHTYIFSQSDATRPNPTRWASTILPTVAVAYILPTAILFYPFANIEYTMLATAVWQFSPVLINLVWVLLTRLAPAHTGESRSTGHILRQAHKVMGSLASLSHLTTLFACFSPSYPDITLSSVFWSGQTPKVSFSEAMNFIFQVDYLIVFACSTLWCLQIRDRARRERNKAGRVTMDLLVLGASVVFLGPGATVSWAVCACEAGIDESLEKGLPLWTEKLMSDTSTVK
ncbi:uncharacterized protein MKK02DRAFT_40662 [Dioszegia hungarica]|uniref:Uncharacterized protein n=1 Tax=Dioszegia hungarica TaxID=4972 RepID=A0AA38H223_9TREE|nr:uncharacterized protein MKK02DRAFT_40662 [Dioszegia hungarica]KAI9632360.1 hypothetical protein MKK02DRAFT_40662 [Dioszegia hungarica]